MASVAAVSGSGAGAVKRAINRLGFQVQRFPAADSLAGLTRRLIAQHGIDLVLDVGANTGQYGRSLRESGYRGPIASFEPVPEAYRDLAQAAAGDASWQVRQLALGSTDGELPLNVAASSSVSSFLAPTADYVAGYEGGQTIRTEAVAVARLDGVLDEVAPQARQILLKCDTQGFDLEVIRGASGCLDRVVAIQAELSVRAIYEGMPGYLEAITEIQGQGYDPVGFFPVVRDPDLRAVELDGLFVRAAVS